MIVTWDRWGDSFILQGQLEGKGKVRVTLGGTARLEGPSQLLMPPGPLVHS